MRRTGALPALSIDVDSPEEKPPLVQNRFDYSLGDLRLDLLLGIAILVALLGHHVPEGNVADVAVDQPAPAAQHVGVRQRAEPDLLSRLFVGLDDGRVEQRAALRRDDGEASAGRSDGDGTWRATLEEGRRRRRRR